MVIKKKYYFSGSYDDMIKPKKLIKVKPLPSLGTVLHKDFCSDHFQS